ncbi:MAG: TsaE protein, required for threonylcarbamoyladenosine t(6)A37 formation in tRNA, partial [uncultured Solirubrobacteraceae bacterium]
GGALRRGGGGQDDVRARRGPRARRHRSGDEPDVHDRPPVRADRARRPPSHRLPRRRGTRAARRLPRSGSHLLRRVAGCRGGGDEPARPGSARARGAGPSDRHDRVGRM